MFCLCWCVPSNGSWHISDHTKCLQSHAVLDDGLKALTSRLNLCACAAQQPGHPAAAAQMLQALTGLSFQQLLTLQSLSGPHAQLAHMLILQQLLQHPSQQAAMPQLTGLSPAALAGMGLGPAGPAGSFHPVQLHVASLLCLSDPAPPVRTWQAWSHHQQHAMLLSTEQRLG